MRERGRPKATEEPKVRDEVFNYLSLVGPRCGVPSLQATFPDVPKAVLTRLLGRFRRHWRQGHTILAAANRWIVPRTVWAMDFTEPDAPIEGRYPKILLIRDLASGKTLVSLPVEAEDHLHVLSAVLAAFTKHGAPLVLKADNGPPFIAAAVKALAKLHDVLLLYSPPYYPRYNGAVEAGVGSHKTHLHQVAINHGRPGQFTCDDVEEARCRSNLLGRPRGASEATPDSVWNLWAGDVDRRRRQFLQTHACFEQAERLQRRYTPEEELEHVKQADIDRIAIARALRERGLLTTQRRRVSQPVSTATCAIIS